MMKQLGNLAMVCAQRPDVLLTLGDGTVAVHAGAGPQRRTLAASWSDDAEISRIIYALNFGELAPGRHGDGREGADRPPYEIGGADRAERIAKLAYLDGLCFECETESCALNSGMTCRFPLVHGRKPVITEKDGCVEGALPL